MRIKLLFLVLVASTLIFNIKAGNITGKVIDSSDSSSMAQCTIKLLTARDSTYINGTTTDDNGTFQLTGIKPGRYIVLCSYIGYDNVSKHVSLTQANPNARLGSIIMGESSIMLKEAVVLGKKTEIKVKEDTIEYNADSYKTQPNAVVEDLLKRLPGVEIGTDGKITSQGKQITKILVDGKEFFSDDPTVATKNIPVDIVDKLQVVDRKSDLARATGVDDGEDETVINLTIKKGMNNGWFGNINAGYGTDNRYAGNVILNKFWDGNQITFLGGANNTNNLGFSDGNSNRFRRFGGVNGINTSQNFGINFNVGKGEAFRVGGDVMYSHSDNDNKLNVDRKYIFADSVSYYRSNTISRDKGHNLRGDFRLKWDIDSMNKIEFRPNFSYNKNNSEQADTSVTIAGDVLNTIVNRSKNISSSDGNSFEFGGEFIYNHQFKQKIGRAFSIQLRYNLSNVHENLTTYSKNTYYLTDKEDIMDQFTQNHTWANTARGRITWTEPLGDPMKTQYLIFSYQAQYKWNNADKLVYDINPTDNNKASVEDKILLTSDITDYLASKWGPAVYNDDILIQTLLSEDSELNEDLSNRFRNDFFSQRIQLGYKIIRKSYNLDLGVSANPSMSKSDNLINDAKSIPTRWVWNYAPYLRFRYKIGKQNSFQADYRANSSQPTMAQLQPVADTSNPLRVVIGNPDLNPTFTNYMNVRYNNFNQEHQRSIMAMGRAQFSSNSIVSRTKHNSETGGQITTYENVNGVWNVMGMGMISFPFKDKRWQFTNNLFARYNVNKGYINGDLNRNSSFSVNESFGISFRTDVFEIEARPMYGIQTTANTVQGQSNPTIQTFGGNLYLNYYLPFGLSVNSNVNFSGTEGYSDGYNKNQWLWNASLSYQFLKGKAATIALKAYDILNQNQNISRNVTASYIQDQEYNSLSRYFMVTFSYRFSTFAGGQNPENKYQDFNRRGYGGRRH